MYFDNRHKVIQHLHEIYLDSHTKNTIPRITFYGKYYLVSEIIVTLEFSHDSGK